MIEWLVPSRSAQYKLCMRCLLGNGMALEFNLGRSASPSWCVNVLTGMCCSWIASVSSGKASFWLAPQEMRMGSLVKDGRSGCRCIILGSLTWCLWESVASFLCPCHASHPCPLCVSKPDTGKHGHFWQCQYGQTTGKSYRKNTIACSVCWVSHGLFTLWPSLFWSLELVVSLLAISSSLKFCELPVISILKLVFCRRPPYCHP